MGWGGRAFSITLLNLLALAACHGAEHGAPSADASRDASIGASTDANNETALDAVPLPEAGARPDAASIADLGTAEDAAAAPLPDCPCYQGDGLYCGSGVETYAGAHSCTAPDLAAHLGDIYSCAGGRWRVTETCGAAGCYVAANMMPDGCHVAGTTKHLWIVFAAGAARRDLTGLFECVLGRTNFSDLARQYPNGYGLALGGSAGASCGMNDYACGVAALRGAGFAVADHDVVELIVPGYCGGDNNARGGGTDVGGLRIIGANVGDCGGGSAQERVAVHEAFEAAADWAAADCCTGEVNGSCPDNGERFCPSCPCTCGQFQSDGSYGGYTLDCGGGRVYTSQRVPVAAGREYDPAACQPMALMP